MSGNKQFCIATLVGHDSLHHTFNCKYRCAIRKKSLNFTARNKFGVSSIGTRKKTEVVWFSEHMPPQVTADKRQTKNKQPVIENALLTSMFTIHPINKQLQKDDGSRYLNFKEAGRRRVD